jgi:hypothetical protein
MQLWRPSFRAFSPPRMVFFLPYCNESIRRTAYFFAIPRLAVVRRSDEHFRDYYILR